MPFLYKNIYFLKSQNNNLCGIIIVDLFEVNV